MDWAEFRKGYSFAVSPKSIMACTCAAESSAMTASIYLPSSLHFCMLSYTWSGPMFLLCDNSLHKHSFMALS